MRDTLTRLDPRFAPQHAAYYLHGLMQYTQASSLPFTRDGFPQTYSDGQPLAFVLRRGNAERRIYVSAGDKPRLDPAALEWADLYAKVNLDPDLVGTADADRVVPIGPSHGLRPWNFGDTAIFAIRAYRAGGGSTATKEHFREFWHTYRRREDDAAYAPAPSEPRYVYYNSWLWAKHDDVNPPRARYVRACQQLSEQGLIEFEGGFTARRRGDMPHYADVTTPVKYALPEYLGRVKRSAVVFNNPAVHGCFGWKLAEFLRLGKAILSLPLPRQMPAPFLPGTHFHPVDDSIESMKGGIRTVIDDPAYRQRLEEAARQYWLEHLTPRVVIRRLADMAFGTVRAGSGSP